MKKIISLFVITLLITSCANQARRIRKRNEIRSEIENVEERAAFASLKGSFSVREQKMIVRALTDDGVITENELNKKLINKLIATGNYQLFE